MSKIIVFFAMALSLMAQAPKPGLFVNSGGSAAGGSGSVTNVATACGITGGPITVTGTVSNARTTNAQVGTTYTVLSGDCGKLVTTSNAGAITLTIPAAGGSFTDGWFVDVLNLGAGTLTCSGATCTLTTGQSARFVSTGATWRVLLGGASGGSTITGCSSGLSVSVNDCILNTAIATTRAVEQGGDSTYCRSTTGNATYTCVLTPTLTTYKRGGCVTLDANFANVTTATLNVDTLGVKSILNRAGGALAAGDITADKPILACYDGTQFIVMGDGVGTSTAPQGEVTMTGPTGTAAGASNAIGTANTMQYWKFFVGASVQLQFYRAETYSGTGAGTQGFAIYDSAGNVVTNSKATVAAPGSNVMMKAAMAAAITLTPGFYYIGYTSTTTTDKLYAMPGDIGNEKNTGFASPNLFYFTGSNLATAGVPPNSIGATQTAMGGVIFWINATY